MRLYKDQRGLTLVEVVIAILLLGVITTMLFRFMNSSIDTHTMAVEQVDSQSSIRLLAYKITDEIRNARNLELQDNTGSVTLDQYIYLDDNTVKQSDELSSIYSMSSNLIQDIDFAIDSKNSKYVIKITITATDGKSLVTEVLLNNITSVTNTSGKVIEYDFNAP